MWSLYHLSPDSATSEQLKEHFQRHGEITKVVLLPSKDGQGKFGYIHFGERSIELKSVKGTEKYEIDGNALIDSHVYVDS